MYQTILKHSLGPEHPISDQSRLAHVIKARDFSPIADVCRSKFNDAALNLPPLQREKCKSIWGRVLASIVRDKGPLTREGRAAHFDGLVERAFSLSPCVPPFARGMGSIPGSGFSLRNSARKGYL